MYESLPWLYIAGGVLALAASYLQRSAVASYVLGLPGLAVLLAGVVVLLRRRDYRRLRGVYPRPDALVEDARRAEEPRR